MLKQITAIIVIIMLILCPLIMVNAKKDVEVKQSTDEIIVKFKEDVDVNKYGTDYKQTLKDGATVLKLKPNKNLDDTLKIYKNMKQVEYAEPNYIADALMSPNDPLYNQQWNFKMVNVSQAWDISNGSGVIVAVIDTGVTMTTDLSNSHFIGGFDFVNNDFTTTDDNGHGTHVTGTIAQTTNNNLGVCGIAYGCTIMPVKVLDASGSGTYSNVANGIYYAVDNGAKVISMSLGGTSPSTALYNAIRYAYDNNVIIVCAGGNSYLNGNPIIYPAYYNEVIAVGGVRLDGIRAYYSSTGSYIDIVAPSGDMNQDLDDNGYPDGILQQKNDNSFVYMHGTSMACPHVSGAVAMLISNNITDKNEIRYRLEKTATDKGAVGYDIEYGWGILNITKALLYKDEPIATPTPTPQKIPKTTPSPMPSYNPQVTYTPYPTITTQSEDIVSLYIYMLPIFVILLPTLLMYVVFRSQYGIMTGAIIGVLLGISADILSAWILIILIIGIVVLLFYKKDEGDIQ